MVSGKHVKPMSPFMLLYANLSGAKGFLFLNQVLLRPEIYQNLISPTPNPRNVGVLIHENVHYQRSLKVGALNFAVSYLTSHNTRLNEELLAYGEQMKYLKRQRVDFDIPKVAKALSSWIYLWCTSYEDAETKLNHLWSSTK